MSLRTRLVRVENKVADREERKRLANCICGGTTLVFPGQAQKFEAEMNQTRAAHGILRFGRIMRIRFVAPETDPQRAKERIRKEDAALNEVLESYCARLAAAEGDSLFLRSVKSGNQEHDFQEL